MVKTYYQLRRVRASIKIQSYLRMKRLRFMYRAFCKAVVILQNRCRKVIAVKMLKRLKLEARDLGKLKQSNETLKKEIDEINWIVFFRGRGLGPSHNPPQEQSTLCELRKRRKKE